MLLHLGYIDAVQVRFLEAVSFRSVRVGPGTWRRGNGLCVFFSTDLDEVVVQHSSIMHCNNVIAPFNVAR